MKNNAVATSETKVGDNDNLSALVAILAQAEQLYLYTVNKAWLIVIREKIRMLN